MGDFYRYVFSMASYEWGIFAPGIREPGDKPYKVVHNILKAHATAYHIYKNEFNESQKGRIGLSADSWWYEPFDPNSEEDREAAERAMQFRVSVFIEDNIIFVLKKILIIIMIFSSSAGSSTH